MDLPLFETFTPEQRSAFGPVREPEIIRATERHVYRTPFLYSDVEAGNFCEIDPCKGVEFKADDGFLTIREALPILSVTVVGSGCVPRGYNIVEWWDEGEEIETMDHQLVKRQRVDNLNGTHPAIWSQWIIGNYPGLSFEDVAPGEMLGAVDCLRKLSDGFYGGFYMGFYENTAYLRIGPPHPHKVTIRCGCEAMEDRGTSIARYPGDYAIRLVETTVLCD